MLSHSGVAYSGCEPTSRYRRAPFCRNTLELRPQLTTRRNRYRATSSGLSRRWPRSVQVTPYSFSRPKMRRSMARHRTPGSRGSDGQRPATTLRGVNRSTHDQPMRMVRLMTADDAFGAKVVVAQLGVEGILWELKGGVD